MSEYTTVPRPWQHSAHGAHCLNGAVNYVAMFEVGLVTDETRDNGEEVLSETLVAERVWGEDLDQPFHGTTTPVQLEGRNKDDLVQECGIFSILYNINGLEQDCRNTTANNNKLELPQPGSNSSI